MKIFKLPDLGEGLQDAEIVEWHVNTGDEITADQPLVSVETAKAIVDIPSPFTGRVAKLYGEVGQLVHVGAPLAGFEGGQAGGDEADSGTVVGEMQVGTEVRTEAPAALAPAAHGGPAIRATP
ncbi:MAG: biotin/lipoyl-containing protein, partial [Thauera sp.]